MAVQQTGVAQAGGCSIFQILRNSNGRRPDFLGIAFFYWYEFAATVVSVWITFIVTEPSSRRERPKRLDEEPRFSRDPSIRREPSRTLTRAG